MKVAVEITEMIVVVIAGKRLLTLLSHINKSVFDWHDGSLGDVGEFVISKMKSTFHYY